MWYAVDGVVCFLGGGLVTYLFLKPTISKLKKGLESLNSGVQNTLNKL